MPSGLLTRVATLETKVTALEAAVREQAKDLEKMSDEKFRSRSVTRVRRRRRARPL